MPNFRRSFFSLLCVFALSSSPGHGAENNGLSLKVRWNNPFNPSQGEVTQFEYQVRGRDVPVLLLIYAVDGHMIRQLSDHLALSDTLYTQTWDGKNDDGDLVDSGVYFAVMDAGRNVRKTTRVVVRRE